MMITRDWVTDLIKVGEALNAEAMRHDIDSLRIQVEPELDYVQVIGYRDGKLVMRARRYGLMDKEEIEIGQEGGQADGQ